MTYLYLLLIDEDIRTWYRLKALSKNNYGSQYNRKDISSLIFIKKGPALVEIKSQNRA